MKKADLKNYLVLAGAALTWFAVIFQFVLMMQQRTASVPETIIRFFSFFTILTNLLVAVFFTSLALPAGKVKRFFSNPANATAVLLYIAVVGIIYNTILKGLRELHGADLFVDMLLHTIVPVYMTVYWFLFVPPGHLPLSKAFSWMLYPFLYCVYVLTRGAFSDFYPYFFLNVTALGYGKTIVNCLYVTLTFLILALLLILAGRLLAKMERR